MDQKEKKLSYTYKLYIISGKKSSVSKVDPCSVCGERVSVRNVIGGFIVVVLMCLGK